MNRREFLRHAMLSAVMGAAALGGVYALIEKLTPPAVPTLLNSQNTQQQGNSTTTIRESTTVAGSSTTSAATASSQSSKSGSKSASTTTQRSNSTSTTTQANSSTAQSVPNGYILLAPLSAVAGKSYAYFNHPSFGTSILINYNGTWKAFSAACTHAGCTVNYTSQLYCPCHAGYFSPVNGAVTGGPPPTPLPEYDIKVINNNLYVGNTVIN